MGIRVTDTAEDEVLTHIRNLDREESWLRKQAANALVRSQDLERKAELLAVKRRQFEFLHRQLTDTSPAPAEPLAPKKTTTHIVAVLGG